MADFSKYNYQRLRKGLRKRKNRISLILKKNSWACMRKLLGYGPPKSYLFVFGCQRSGTTFLQSLFQSDLKCAVFKEFSEITIDRNKSVLKPLKKLKEYFSGLNVEYVVAKPLFESDRMDEILTEIPHSYGLWMYRDYRDVVNSMKEKWGSDFFNISREVEYDGDGWRLESEIRRIEKQASLVVNEDVDFVDECYSRYWLMRNKVIFSSNYIESERLTMCGYDQLVKDSKGYFCKVLAWIGIYPLIMQRMPKSLLSAHKEICEIRLSNTTRNECEKMQQDLESLSKRKSLPLPKRVSKY